MKYWTWKANEKNEDGTIGKEVQLHLDAGLLIFTVLTLKDYLRPCFPGLDFSNFEAVTMADCPKKSGNIPARYIEHGIKLAVFKELGIADILGVNNGYTNQCEERLGDASDSARISDGRPVIRRNRDATSRGYQPIRR